MIKENRIGLVYFGNSMHLEKGGEMEYLYTMTTLDRFTYPEQPILFFYNTDEECKRRRNLSVNEHSLVLYISDKVVPFVVQGPDFDLSPMNVYHWISASITEGTLKWSRRAANTVV